MALGKYLEVDGVRYPNPTANNGAPLNIEKINTSESGKRLTSAQRLGQLSQTFTFQVSSYWRNKIIEDCKKLSVNVNYCGVDYEGTLRLTGDVLAPNSENSDNTNGYWTLTVVFIER